MVTHIYIKYASTAIKNREQEESLLEFNHQIRDLHTYQRVRNQPKQMNTFRIRTEYLAFLERLAGKMEQNTFFFLLPSLTWEWCAFSLKNRKCCITTLSSWKCWHLNGEGHMSPKKAYRDLNYINQTFIIAT